jgi:hypothetical protein
LRVASWICRLVYAVRSSDTIQLPMGEKDRVRICQEGRSSRTLLWRLSVCSDQRFGAD